MTAPAERPPKNFAQQVLGQWPLAAVLLGSFAGLIVAASSHWRAGTTLIGLSITMGLMNFINLAHGAFAMIGGYASVWFSHRFGMPFLATLPLAFAVAGLAGGSGVPPGSIVAGSVG